MPFPTLRVGISFRRAKGIAKGPQFAPLRTQLNMSTMMPKQ
jgi:hypothetical protein